jgi:hypothetical protein
MVSYIVLTGRADKPLQINKFFVYDKNGLDISLTGTATGSPPLVPASKPSNVLKGHPAGGWQEQEFYHSLTPGAMWRLDFPQPIDVSQAIFWNRTDAESGRADGVVVSFYNMCNELIHKHVLNSTVKQVIALPK